VNVTLVLHQRLRAVSVVHVPVDDEHALGVVTLTRVVRTDGDRAEEAKAHRTIREGVVSRGADRAEAANGVARKGEIDSVEHGTSSGSGRVPRSFAGDGVGIETSASRVDQRFHHSDVAAVVRERELVFRRMPALDVLESLKELGVLTQRTRNGAQTADVLGVTPAGVVATAVGVRDVGDSHRAPRRRRDVHSTSKSASMKARSMRLSGLRRCTSAGAARGGPRRSMS
jgi:hypothetical protein